MLFDQVVRFATRETIEEVHRVLRPGGGFGVIWNIEDCEFPLDAWNNFYRWNGSILCSQALT